MMSFIKDQDYVRGTEGYEAVTRQFVAATMSIDFRDLHHHFIEFIPKGCSEVLDIGAGIGRDAWELSKMGHVVTAVEPIKAYRLTGANLFASNTVKWLDDSLPKLKLLGQQSHFDFILVSGVLHHLDAVEQHGALIRISELLNPGGICALSLRNGPAGAGTCIFPTNSDAAVSSAESCNLKTRLRIDNLPSLMRKEKVIWSKLVFQKQGPGIFREK